MHAQHVDIKIKLGPCTVGKEVICVCTIGNGMHIPLKGFCANALKIVQLFRSQVSAM